MNNKNDTLTVVMRKRLYKKLNEKTNDNNKGVGRVITTKTIKQMILKQRQYDDNDNINNKLIYIGDYNSHTSRVTVKGRGRGREIKTGRRCRVVLHIA